MSNLPVGANLLLGKGRVWFDRFDANGSKTGLRYLGNCTSFTVQPEDDVIEMRDSAQASTPLLARAVRSRDINLSLTLTEFMNENLALALMGNELSFTQSAGAVVDEPIGTVKKDRAYKLLGRQISAVTVTKTPSTNLVEGTDYELDLVSGVVYIKSTAVNVTDGDNVVVDYTKAAITAPNGLKQVAVGLATVVEGWLMFVGDPARGPKYDADFWRVSLQAETELGLVSDDWATFDLSGKVLSDVGGHPSSPYGLITQKA